MSRAAVLSAADGVTEQFENYKEYVDAQVKKCVRGHGRDLFRASRHGGGGGAGDASGGIQSSDGADDSP